MKVIVYMLKCTEWTKTKAQPREIVGQMHLDMKIEKEQQSNLAKTYRKAINKTLKEKQNEIKG